MHPNGYERMGERFKKHIVGYKTVFVNGKSRTEIPGRLPDDEYAAMNSTVKVGRELHGRTNEWKNGKYTRFRDRRKRYVEEERGREN